MPACAWYSCFSCYFYFYCWITLNMLNIQTAQLILADPIKASPVPGQAGPPVIWRGQELSQCFLSDCRALGFHSWSKLCLSVPDCHNPPSPLPPHTPSSPCPHPSPPCHYSPRRRVWKSTRSPCSSRDSLEHCGLLTSAEVKLQGSK